MKRFAVIGALAVGVIVNSASAQSAAVPAQAAGVLELTMRLMPANAESSTVITSTIELRKDSAGAYAPKAPGAEAANHAREDGRAYGEAAAAAARDNRESASRRSRPDLAGDRASAPDRHTPPPR
jgi:hypothetical protein